MAFPLPQPPAPAMLFADSVDELTACFADFRQSSNLCDFDPTVAEPNLGYGVFRAGR
jgi:hypothetical protein